MLLEFALVGPVKRLSSGNVAVRHVSMPGSWLLAVTPSRRMLVVHLAHSATRSNGSKYHLWVRKSIFTSMWWQHTQCVWSPPYTA